MNKLVTWFRQPSTLTAFGVAAAAIVYWFTKSAELAAVALAAILGTVSDGTASLLTKVENIENIVANIVVPPTVTTVKSVPVAGMVNLTNPGVKPVVMLLVFSGLLFGMSACGAQQAAVVATVTTTLAQAKTDIQNAIGLYGVAKGIAGIAVIANPALSPTVAKATALGDAIATKAQLALNDATTDAATLEALVSQITQLANTVTLQTAGVIKVVPAS